MSDLRYFEDIVTGEAVQAGPIVVTREAIIAFARQYDPQPFHLDERAAAASLLGGLAASGWHSTAIGMRLYYDAFLRNVASMGAPGVDEVRWLRPVRPGDALSLVLTVGEKRASASRPDRGFVSVTLDIRNGAGDSVMTQRYPLMVARRGAVQSGAGRPEIPPPVISATSAADLMLCAPFDDVEVGHLSRLGAQHFTPAIITGFAKIYDPQYFHMDAEAAVTSHFGGLVASGWQTAAFWMKHYIAARDRSGEARQALGLPVATGGPSPGLANLKWLRPVHAGESIRYGMQVTGKRRTGRSGWGLISTLNTGHAGDGALVFSFEGRLLWPTEADRRDPSPSRFRPDRP